jgi:hypothetical protein
VFVVNKYEEAARRPVQVHVVDGRGEPIAGAQVRFYAQGPRSSSNDPLEASTNAQGNAEIQLYPLEYSFQVTASGKNPANGNVTVDQAGDVPERKVTLYSALQGSIRVKWLRSVDGDGDESSTGETIIAVPAAQRGYNPMEFSPEMWLRPVQVKDQLALYLYHATFGYAYPGRSDASTWVGSVSVDTPDDDTQRWRITKEQFDALDLTKIDELKKAYPQAAETTAGPARTPGSRAFTAQEGSILVGTFQTRDPRMNRPVDITFKALVEKLAPVEPEDEP